MPPTLDWSQLEFTIQSLLEPLIRELVAEEVAKAVRAGTPRPPLRSPKGQLVLFYSQVHKLYGIGRSEWNRLINTGEMKATSRRMRGGFEGWVVSAEEAARVLGGNS